MIEQKALRGIASYILCMMNAWMNDFHTDPENLGAVHGAEQALILSGHMVRHDMDKLTVTIDKEVYTYKDLCTEELPF